MIKNYRALLKQLYRLKAKEEIIGSYFMKVSSNKIRKDFDKEQYQWVQSLRQMIVDCNKNNQRSVLKVLRLYAGNSEIINEDLQFRSGYKSKVILMVEKDIQFNILTEYQKEKVRQVLVKVCDKKPKVRYRKIESYFVDKNSENHEKELEVQMIKGYDILRESSSIFGKIIRQLHMKKHEPLSYRGQCLYKKGIVII